MEKNTVIAVILCIAVLIGYQYLMKDHFQQAVPQQKEAAKVEQKPAAQEAVKQQPAAVALKPAVKQAAEKLVTVENDLFKMVLTTNGATIKQVELKKYKDAKGMPIVLKGNAALAPLAIGSDETVQYGSVPFSVNGSDIKFSGDAKNASLSFEYRSGSVSISRTFTFSKDDYAVSVKESVKGIDTYFVALGKDFGIFEKDESSHYGPVVLKDADRIEITAKDLKEKELKDPKSQKDSLKWIAQEDKYFVSFIVPKSAVEEAKAWVSGSDAVAGMKLKAGDSSYTFYAGPKEFDILDKYNAGMEHVIDFGFFSFLARPLFWLLKWINGFVNNYGIAIILLTVVTRIPFIPLINKGQTSMKRMADLQPRMNEIKEKYKKDPQKMQKEIMELYKKNKVNPVGGCLPMLLQIPFFFALYSILSNAIEMRHAPFMLWVTDLATKDPYYVLPLVMGATMFIQQKMTPATGDPKQQKIMMFMPLIFTFMFLNFASGLVLFWLINNILSIAQQFYINNKNEKAVSA